MRAEDHIVKQISEYLNSQYPKLIWHFDLSSGGCMTIGMAKRNSLINKCKGYPDLFIAKSKTVITSEELPFDTEFTYFGLFLELKTEGTTIYKKDGTLRKDQHLEEQNLMLYRLERYGYMARFACGFFEAKKIIDSYLND